MDKKWMTIPLLIFLLLITQGCTEENGENNENADKGEEAVVKSNRVIFTIESEKRDSVGKGIYELIYEIDAVEKGKYAIQGFSYEKVEE